MWHQYQSSDKNNTSSSFGTALCGSPPLSVNGSCGWCEPVQHKLAEGGAVGGPVGGAVLICALELQPFPFALAFWSRLLIARASAVWSPLHSHTVKPSSVNVNKPSHSLLSSSCFYLDISSTFHTCSWIPKCSGNFPAETCVWTQSGVKMLRKLRLAKIRASKIPGNISECKM